MTTQNIRLCVPATTLDADVVRLYEGAFPAAERESVGRLSDLLAKGKQLCHRTLNENDELLCFTIVTVLDRFTFLSYMATDPTRRSGGIGSKHLAKLLDVIKETFPDHLGLFFEIEATEPSAEVLSEEDRVNRHRRQAFYERAGARLICPEGVYLTPHYNDRNKEWEGELMGFEFKNELDPEELIHVLEQIYWVCYTLPPTHPLVKKVIEYFGPCLSPLDDCAEKESERDANDTTSGDNPADATENPDDCGCEARGRAIRDWMARLWQRLKSLFGSQ
jgi:hypothetical protein